MVVLGKVLGGGYFGVVKEGIYIRPIINDGEDPDVRVAGKTLKSKCKWKIKVGANIQIKFVCFFLMLSRR